MNHDATHCIDYDKRRCPKHCYRADLTEELKRRPDLIGIPISWAHYLGTEQCDRKVMDMSDEKDGKNPSKMTFGGEDIV